MKTITQYQNEIQDLKEKAIAISNKATTQNRDLTPQELDLKNELLDAVEDYEKIVNTLQREERIAARLEKPQPALTKPRPQATPGVEVGIDNRSKDKFNSLGQQLAAVMRAGVPGGTVDPRLFNAATGLNETVPSDGGFLVQTDFSSTLLMDIMKTGKLAPLCQRVTISGNANGTKINGVDETNRATGSRYGGIRGYWMAEADEKTKSKPKFRQIELSLKKLAALVYATDEMLDDSAQLESVIRQGVASEFGFMLDDAIINGTGAGQPLGILNAGCLVTQAAESQAAGTLVPENIVKMWSRLFPDSQANAVWLINQALTPQLHLLKVQGTNSGVFPAYMPPGGLSGSPYGTLLGRPVMPIEQCQAPDTAGDIILADFSNGYVLAEKGGIKSDISIHVRFIYDESVFRFVMRIDGQPVRAAALTPYKGGSTATLSHFVTLAGSRTA